MSNGDEMLKDMEFENQLRELGDDQPGLIRFVAREQFKTSKVQKSYGKRIKSLESKNKKIFGFAGAFGAVIATAVTAVFDYLSKRGA